MASLKLVKKNLQNKLNKEVIPQVIEDCFKQKNKQKRKSSTNYMLWLNDNRERFEICTKCNIDLKKNDEGKKTCPKCNAKISAMEIAKRGGEEWKKVSEEEKKHYGELAKAKYNEDLGISKDQPKH